MKKLSLTLPRRLVVPLFPLPNAILFPGARLTLYIFEPCFKQMIDDVMEGDEMLSVALLENADDPTARAEICGLGQITDIERLPKNEKNIVLTGIARVQVLREVRTDPYISAEVKTLKQRLPGPKVHDPLFNELRLRVKEWLFRMRAGNIKQLADLGHVNSMAELCDFFGANLIDDFATRQKLLNELDVAHRAEAIIEIVKTQLYRYSAPFEN